MIRSELIALIAGQNPHLFAKDVEAVVAAILNRIATALVDGDRVELRDFGAFSVREHEARTSRNPRTGGEVSVPARTHVHFKPGKAMRERLNWAEVTSDAEMKQLQRAN